MTVSVELTNTTQVRQQLASIAPEMRRGTTRAITTAGAPIVMDAKSRAGEWSTRIPGAISMRTAFGARSGGVFIRVNSAIAPHARPYEGVTGRGSFRHPVYGTDRWVSHQSRPFIAPALRAGEPRVRAGIEQAISDALRV